MKSIVAILSVCLIAITYCFGKAETLILHANKDTYIDQLSPNNNYGQNWKMLINGSSPPSHGLLHFDFNSLPEMAQIDDATLTFLVHTGWRTKLYFLHPITNPWDEDAATWNHATESETWNTAGGDYQSTSFIELPLPASLPNWMVTDITSLLKSDQGGIDRNIAEYELIIKADTQFSKIVSREFDSFPRAATCHSCHGGYSHELDEGKSTECENCHAEGDIPLTGEPTLILNYTMPSLLFQFVQVSDTHLGRSPQQEDNLYNAVEQINEINPAFVLFTGDLTEHGEILEYEAFKDALYELNIPYYCIPGDNDILDYASQGGNLERYREQLGDDYYTFEHQNITFIGLNNNAELSLDHIQRKWLEEELKEGNLEIVFAHKGILDHQNGMPFSEAEQLISLLNTYHVTMFLNGDVHESAEHTNNTHTHYIWCDNLSWFHSGTESYNLYKVYADHILLYHVYYDGFQEYAGSFSLVKYPDLILSAVSEELIDTNAKTYKVNYTIKNKGMTPALESVTCLMIDGNQVGKHNCPPIDTGAIYEDSFEGPFACTDGSDLIEVCVNWGDNCDGTGVIDEDSETNNCSEDTFMISSTSTTVIITTTTIPKDSTTTTNPITTSTTTPITISTTTTIPKTTTTIPVPIPTTTSSSYSTTTTIITVCLCEKIYEKNHDEVKILKLIRDEVLSKTPEGREIIKLYYQWSPVLLNAVEDDKILKRNLKKLIDDFLRMVGQEVK